MAQELVPPFTSVLLMSLVNTVAPSLRRYRCLTLELDWSGQEPLTGVYILYSGLVSSQGCDVLGD